MKKYKIRRKRKTIKTSYIAVAFVFALMFLSISYAAFSTTLRINGTATGEWQQLSVTYLHIDNSSSYPSTIRYMETYSYTFTNPPTIQAVSMGGVQLTSGTDYTYANGTLTIPDVTGALVIDGELPQLQDFSIKYVYGDNIEFNGSSWLDTGIALFSSENFDRDFELTVDIDSYTYDTKQDKKQNTIVNCVDHSVSPWHGFLLRLISSSQYALKVTNAQNSVTETNLATSAVQNVLITRENKVLYGDLLTGSDSNLSQIGDFTNYTSRISSNLLIGSDINNNAPNKCFVGELSNITVKNYYEASEAPITLPNPDRTGYVFKGWYSDSSFTNRVGYGGETYTPTGDTVLYAKWILPDVIEEEEEYTFNGQYNFAQNGYINTSVYLYTANNIHRNFEMSFDIVSLGNSSNNDTLMSATKNVLRIKNISSELMTLATSGKTATSNVDNIPNTITNVRIIRINDKLYYSFNGQTFLKINDYSDYTSYSSNPVLFGADFNSSAEVYRIFDGTLANMSVKFISDSATLADYTTPHGSLATVYSQSGNYEFDGTNNINTGIKLFSYDSYDKNFEISFNVVSISSSVGSQASLVNSKYENSGAGYPGFVLRLDSNKTKYEFTAAQATSGSPINRTIVGGEFIKISRRDMKLYIQYNNETEQQAYDFSGFTNFFNTPVTIGSSLDSSGNLFRPFIGTLSDIVVKLEQ
ncbi:MAG: InlB B-repeat-containing protein [Clostridia bacterium]|nr:InlB B-repeat-containing protein [Clostridia bacterium]